MSIRHLQAIINEEENKIINVLYHLMILRIYRPAHHLYHPLEKKQEVKILLSVHTIGSNKQGRQSTPNRKESVSHPRACSYKMTGSPLTTLPAEISSITLLHKGGWGSTYVMGQYIYRALSLPIQLLFVVIIGLLYVIILFLFIF